MPISFEQPAPVGAAAAVGQAQGAAALRAQQLAAASAYDQAALAVSGQLSAAQERGREADNQDAVAREKIRFDQDAEYLRSATQLADTQMRIRQAAAESQQRAAIAQQELQLRQKQFAFEAGELSPAEQAQLLRYQNAKGEVQQALAEGKLTPDQASFAMNRLQSQIGPLRLRKQVMDEYHQELQNQQLSQANARAASMEAENAKFHAKTVPERVQRIPLPDGSSVAVLDNGPGRAPTLLPSQKADKRQTDAEVLQDIRKDAWEKAKTTAGKDAMPDDLRKWFQTYMEEETKHARDTGRLPPEQPGPQNEGAPNEAAQAQKQYVDTELKQYKADRDMVKAISNLPPGYKEGHLNDISWAEHTLEQYGGDVTKMPLETLKRLTKIRETMDYYRNAGVWKKG